MALNLVTAPATEPVKLAEMKNHLRVDISEDDDLIVALTGAAREWCESFRRQSFVTQTWDFYQDDWPSEAFLLPVGPVQSVTGITYTDEDGNEATVSADDYVVDAVSEPARIVLKGTASWPSVTLREVNGIAIRFVAGYGDAAAVPESVRAAIKLLTGHLYENRESVVIGSGLAAAEVPFGVKALLWPKRVLRF